MERTGKDFTELFPILKGETSVMFTESANLPAKVIKDFRKRFKTDKPILKGAYVQESFFLWVKISLIHLKTSNLRMKLLQTSSHCFNRQPRMSFLLYSLVVISFREYSKLYQKKVNNCTNSE